MICPQLAEADITGQKPGRNLAAQQDPDLMPANPLCCRPGPGQQVQFRRLKRREFVRLIGSATAAWPLTARAQQTQRVGILIPLHSQSDREGQANLAAFLETFQKLGWADGRNVPIAYRWGAGDPETYKAAAAELVRSAPDVIVVASSQGLTELKRLTSTIPLVFTQVGDPLDSGFDRAHGRYLCQPAQWWPHRRAASLHAG